MLVSCQHHDTRSGSTSSQEQGGPETRTVCTRTNSLGSYWARHSCQTYSVRTEAARTLPPLGLARNSHEARQGAYNVSNMVAAKGINLPAKATSIVARHVHGRCTELSPRRVTLPPGGQGRGNLFKAQIEFIGRRSAAYGADRIHLV